MFSKTIQIIELQQLLTIWTRLGHSIQKNQKLFRLSEQLVMHLEFMLWIRIIRF